MEFNTEKIFYHGTNQDFENFEFKKSFREGFLGALKEVECQAFFFTTEKATAHTFAKNRAEFFGGDPVVKDFYLATQKTLDLTGNFEHQRYHNTDDFCWDTVEDLPVSSRPMPEHELQLMNDKAAFQKLENILGVDLEYHEAVEVEKVFVDEKQRRTRDKYHYNTEELLLLLDNPDVIENIKKNGYDSVKCEEQSYNGQVLGESIAVFSNDQIISKSKYDLKNKKSNNEVEIKLVNNKEILKTVRDNECFNESLGMVNHQRDYLLAFKDNKIVGFAILYDKSQDAREALLNVTSLSMIEVDEDYWHQGIGTQLLEETIKYIKENERILKRTDPTPLGDKYIKDKFGNMLDNANVNYIPHNLIGIYQRLEAKYDKFKTLSSEDKIDLMNELSEKALSHDLCKRFEIKTVKDFNSIDFYEAAYETVDDFVEKNKRKNKIKPR